MKFLPNWQRNPLLFTLCTLAIAFIVWASFFKLDVASYANGQVVPEGQIKRIQHLEGGIISEIKVHEGQRVSENQIIALLEDVNAESNIGDLQSRIASLELKTLRINANLGKDITFKIPNHLKKDFPELSSEAQSAFSVYLNRFSAMIKNHEARVSQRQAEISEAQERLKGLKTQSQLIKKQLSISTALLKQKLTHEYEHLQLKKELAKIETDVASTTSSIERAKTGLAEATSALTAFRSDEELTLRKELIDATAELNSLREQIRKPADLMNRSIVRAPSAGTIMTIFFKNKGGVIAPGGTLATLVPEGETLLIDAQLPISEIGYVRMGSPARLSIASGSSGFHAVDARVVHISPDAITDEKTGTSHYLVRLAPSQTFFRRGTDTYPMRPGVQILAAIITGQRSVLSLLLDPFLGSGVKPLTER